MFTKQCEYCLNTFNKAYTSSQSYWNRQRFCSIRCGGLATRVIKRTGEKTAEYITIHAWVRYHKGPASKINKCSNRDKQWLPFKCSQKSKSYGWANLSGEYKRDVLDWDILCQSCHTIFDMHIKSKNKIQIRTLPSHSS